MIDISSLAVEETGVIELNGPDGSPLIDADGNRASVTVYGPGSRKYQAAQAKRNSAVTQALRKGSKSQINHREIDAHLLADCTLSFDGFDYKGLPQNRETFLKAYLDNGIGWLADQVYSEIGDWANFTQS